MFQKVVIGVDGRSGGQDAIALARTLAPDAELVLGNAFPFAPTVSRIASIEYRSALEAESHAVLREARATAGLSGLPSSFLFFILVQRAGGSGSCARRCCRSRCRP